MTDALEPRPRLGTRPGRSHDHLIGVAAAETSDYVALIDVSGHVLAVSRGAEALAGLARQSLIGKQLWACPPFDVDSATAERLHLCYERAVRGEFTPEVIERGTGEAKIATEYTIKGLRGPDDGSEFFVVHGRDVTVPRDADQKLEDLRRERDALVRRCRALELANRASPLSTGPAPVPTALPSSPSSAPMFVAPGPPAALGRPRILVVEDNPEMNRFLTVALSRNFEVDSALDGAAGLARAIESPPDLVLTDVVMPRLNGDALVRELRGRRELDDVPIVLLTAKADDEMRVRLLREGAQDYLAKPFSAKELLVRVGNLVDVKRTRQILKEEVATQTRDLESLARALAARSRELAGALDITRVARENAERAGEAKNMFLSVASHELRTPIAALQLRVDRLRRGLGAHPTPDNEDTFRSVQRAIDRLTALVESLLQYSKVQSNVMPMAPQTFDVAALLGEIVDETRGTAEQKGLKLEYHRPDHGLLLESDPALFRLVVTNLVDNAMKFTDHGQVEMLLDEQPSFLRVRVRDTGPGVAPGDRGRIFEPFQHLEPADKKHTPGVGLGLALVREVMTVLGGSVELESGLGAGSTFSVLVPLSRQVVSAPSESPQT